MTTDFFPGDIVECCVTYYSSYSRGDHAQVLSTSEGSKGSVLIELPNYLAERGASVYKAGNWKLVRRGSGIVSKPKERPEMANAYEKTKYFGVQLSHKQRFDEHIDIENDNMTRLHDSKHAAVAETQSLIKEDEEWVILQTIARIRLSEPKPPIVITEYK